MKQLLIGIVVFLISFNANAWKDSDKSLWSEPATLCGWVTNDMPSGMEFHDAMRPDWIIATIDDRAVGMNENLVPLDKGTSCICMKAQTIFELGLITNIISSKKIDDSKCESDPALQY